MSGWKEPTLSIAGKLARMFESGRAYSDVKRAAQTEIVSAVAGCLRLQMRSDAGSERGNGEKKFWKHSLRPA
jgi:hypothetical protein